MHTFRESSVDRQDSAVDITYHMSVYAVNFFSVDKDMCWISEINKTWRQNFDMSTVNTPYVCESYEKIHLSHVQLHQPVGGI
jgi:hypothetical protein